MSLNSFFNEPTPVVATKTVIKKPTQPKKPRKIRSDKCHDIKFPVTNQQLAYFKMLYKQSKPYYKQKRGKDLSQTKFNTLLLMYALERMINVNWNAEYEDTKRYLHVKPVEHYYEQIGGSHGLSTQKGLSDRKTTYYVMISALEEVRKGGISLEQIL